MFLPDRALRTAGASTSTLSSCASDPAIHIRLIVAFAMLGGLGGCGNKDAAPVPANDTATTHVEAQAVVPPPPGDATPKPADETTRAAAEGNEKSGNPGGSAQSTVGTAASGAPPYTLNGAPEANKAPNSGEPPKK